MNFAKITDKIIAEFITSDMSKTRDVAQYGNQKNVSIQHYLVNLVNKILVSLDGTKNSESMAAFLMMVDWSKAFDRQSHKLGIQSFIDNGVRPSLIPILMSFFIGREMTVKWKGHLSSLYPLPGGGPQGDELGILEYLSQTDKNTSFIDQDEKFKFIDDLSFLEIINLISIGLSSYDCWKHVPSDIATSNDYIDSSKLSIQSNLNKILDWTNGHQMKLNADKTKYMIFNFSQKYQANTRIILDDKVLDQVSSTKLLGLTISSDLTWKQNTASLVKRAYSRMIILKNLFNFGVSTEDLVQIYTLYIRSVVEQSAVVWHSSITQNEVIELERIQKVALRIILKHDYVDYDYALKTTGLETLSTRRQKLCISFAKKCVKNEQTKKMFPVKIHQRQTRRQEKYVVPFAKTERFKNSAIPYMARLLNSCK